jgi:beta-glucuronidase
MIRTMVVPIPCLLGVIVLGIVAGIVFVLRLLFFVRSFTSPDPASPAGRGSGDFRTRATGGATWLEEGGLPFETTMQSNRAVLDLSSGWEVGREGTGQESLLVDLPDCFNSPGRSLKDFEGRVGYARGFTVSEGFLERGVNHILRVSAVAQRAEVLLDGLSIGRTEDAWLPLSLDLSGKLKAGRRHRLAVVVDNRIGPHDIPPRLFPGHNLGWWPWGGIFGSVRLEARSDPYCFSLRALDTDLALPLDAVGAMRAQALFWRNSTNSELRVEAEFTVSQTDRVGNDGPVIASGKVETAFKDGEPVALAELPLCVPDARSWSPGSPSRYALHARCRGESLRVEFGFRHLEAKAGRLLLDGEALLLEGLCRHQEDGGSGAAQGTVSIEEDLDDIASLGANFVRLAHYPHDEGSATAAGRRGLAVWSEVPFYQAGMGIIRHLFDKTKAGRKSPRLTLRLLLETRRSRDPALLLAARRCLLKLVERDRNEPAILFWGLGNECWSLNPASGRALGWLRREVEALDRSRICAFATMALPTITTRFDRSADELDLVAVNEYFGWYYGDPEDASPFIQELSRRWPGKPVLVSEVGADSVEGRRSEKPVRGDLSEDWQAHLLETQWRSLRELPAFAGWAVWLHRDFPCPEYREDNAVPFYNLKGLRSADGRAKLAFGCIRSLYSAGKVQLPPGKRSDDEHKRY